MSRVCLAFGITAIFVISACEGQTGEAQASKWLNRLEAAASDSPADAPGGSISGNAYAGNWGLSYPAQSITFSSVERDFLRGVETKTVTTDFSGGLDGVGAVQISLDGTYRMSLAGKKWSGQWGQDESSIYAGRGGIVLRHPDGVHDFLVYRNDAGEIEGNEYPFGGMLRVTMEPASSALLMEVLLTPVDGGTLAGKWKFWLEDGANRWESGSLVLSQDGTYQYVDEDGTVVGGTWAAEGEMARMTDMFGPGRDGFLKMNEQREGWTVLVGNFLDLAGERVG